MNIRRSLIFASLFMGCGCVFDGAAIADAPVPEGMQFRRVDPRQVWSAVWPAIAEGRRPELATQLVALFTEDDPQRPRNGWYQSGSSTLGWNALAAWADRDRNSAITRAEFSTIGSPEHWERLDRDADGLIEASDFDWSTHSSHVLEEKRINTRFLEVDRNTDGRISRDEWNAWFSSSSAGDGSVSVAEFRELLTLDPEPKQRFSLYYRWNRAKSTMQGDLGSMFEGPKVGELAPNFTLKTHDGSASQPIIDPSDRRPTVLIFGNFTCPNFRSHSGIAAELHQRYSDRVRFVGIYVREAHPTDGWSTRRNAKSGIQITQPVTFEERRAIAERCRTTLALPMPLLVDELDDRAGNGYSAMPDRLYLLDADGRVVFKGGRGPFGFQPAELEQILVLHLIERGRASNATE
ncbi:MAG: deiodinase family protein [Isosphaeraceae bacterium]|nr:deiodinase family protein [Isosphaeraceae bacterium]